MDSISTNFKVIIVIEFVNEARVHNHSGDKNLFDTNLLGSQVDPCHPKKTTYAGLTRRGSLLTTFSLIPTVAWLCHPWPTMTLMDYGSKHYIKL